MSQIRSFFLKQAEMSESNPDKLKDYFLKVDCCADIRSWVNKIYYSVVRDNDLHVSKAIFEICVKILI